MIEKNILYCELNRFIFQKFIYTFHISKNKKRNKNMQLKEKKNILSLTIDKQKIMFTNLNY